MNKPVPVINFREVNNYLDHIIINTTSRSADWGRELSPFFVGPVDLYNGQTAQNVENAWQFTKVYKQHTDANGEPTQAYYDWAIKGWNDTYAHRYPMGRGAVPLYSLWRGEKLGYIDARKEIYAPVYAKAVMKTNAFHTLLDLYESGATIALLDFDAYDYLKLNMNLFDVMNNPNKKMGHAFILAMLLQYPSIREDMVNYQP